MGSSKLLFSLGRRKQKPPTRYHDYRLSCFHLAERRLDLLADVPACIEKKIAQKRLFAAGSVLMMDGQDANTVQW